MMMIPKRRDFDLLDDMFGGVFFNEGESKLMKTDIKEKKDEYVIDIDLPGYEKEGIKLNIQDGYLTVHATVNKEEKDEEKGKFVRKERYSGEYYLCVPWLRCENTIRQWTSHQRFPFYYG